MHKQGLPSLMDVCVMCSESLANLVNLRPSRTIGGSLKRNLEYLCPLVKCIQSIHILLNTCNYYVKTKTFDSAVIFNTVLKCMCVQITHQILIDNLFLHFIGKENKVL